MRARFATLGAALLLSGALIPVTASVVHAQTPEEQTDEGEAQEGQGEAETETGGESAETPTEEGPPWTYQMARIGLGILVLTAIGMGGLYYRFVVARQRGEV